MKKEHICRIFSRIPELETERLILRKMRVGDCDDMFEYAQRSDVTEFLTWKPHPDVFYTKEYLAFIGEHYAAGDFFDWAIVLREENKMIGTCGFTRFNYAANSAEVGYVINPKYRGVGIAPEAVGKVIEFGFEKLGLNRIEAKFMEDNAPSRRVMEKLGMTFEGIRREEMLIKGIYRNIGTCSILRSEYFSHSGKIIE